MKYHITFPKTKSGEKKVMSCSRKLWMVAVVVHEMAGLPLKRGASKIHQDHDANLKDEQICCKKVDAKNLFVKVKQNECIYHNIFVFVRTLKIIFCIFSTMCYAYGSKTRSHLRGKSKNPEKLK